MIYLEHTTDPQIADIPKSWDRPDGALAMHLRHTATHRALALEAERAVDDTASYHHISVSLPEGTDCGEYEYELRDGEGILSEGVARIGEIDNDIKQYEGTTEIKQYRG